MADIDGGDIKDLTPASLAALRSKLSPEVFGQFDTIVKSLDTAKANIVSANVGAISVGAESGPAKSDTHLSISVVDKQGVQFAFKFPTSGGAPLISYATADNPADHKQVPGDTTKLAGIKALGEVLRAASTNGFTATEKTLLAALGSQVLVNNKIIPASGAAAQR